MAVYLKSEAEIEAMRKADQVVARVLTAISKAVKPGVSTLELDRMAEEMTLEAGAKPAFKGYQGAGPYPFPGTLCTSINSEVVHGIPSEERKLEEGDILSVDFGVVLDGFFGDSALTIPVGQVNETAQRLMDTTREALERAIAVVQPDNHLNDIGEAIQGYVEEQGFSVVRDFVGHGIGRSLHEDPQVPHYRTSGNNLRLRPGLVIAIEPMINEGTHKVESAEDGWTVVTQDRKLSAHFEHSVAVGKDGPIVLSRRAEGEA